MNLQPTEEQRLLRESVTRWVPERGCLPISAADPNARWREMGRMGWLGMTLAESHGGLGQGLEEACVLAEGLGAGPVAEPYAAAIVQAAGLIEAAGDDAQRARWLPGVIDGTRLVVLAHGERGDHLREDGPRLLATPAGDGWVLSGLKSMVPAGGRADAWLVSARLADANGQASDQVAIFHVARGTRGVDARGGDSVDGMGTAEIRFENAPVGAGERLAAADHAALERVIDHGRVICCAEAIGGMRALLAATSEYLRTRKQFGRPLAMNQVLRHRAADLSIACEEARSILMTAIHAAQLADQNGQRPEEVLARTRAAAGAWAKVGAAARKACEEAIQMHGGMGVTEELTVGAWLRRQLALEALAGSPERTLRRHARLRPVRMRITETPPIPLPDGFVDEVRAFLNEQVPVAMRRASHLSTSVFSEPEMSMPWHRALHRKGWIAPAWPVEYGGTGWSLAQRWFFETECARAGAPALAPLGLRMAGPVIQRFGTPEQKAHYLPRILSGDDYWCQGYSEPGAGSDLASLSCRAVREGDHYVINGSKIWTSHAHHANRMFALVRTGDAEMRKHDGISFLLIDMALPGITVRPIRSMSGDHEVNQVFFDDVKVPVSCRLGEENQGWTIAKYLLEFERGGAISSGRLHTALARTRRLAESLVDMGGDAMTDPDLALAMSAIEIDADTQMMTELRVMSTLQTGQNPGTVSSLLKLRWSEIHQAITKLGVRMLGADILAWERVRPLYQSDEAALLGELARPIVPNYLNARAYTIFGGTSEIQREIIAREVLG